VTGEVLARRTLRWDAVYCAGGGLLAIAFALPLARFFSVPSLILVATGAASIGWASVLWRLAQLKDWRRFAAIVAAVNLVAVAAIAVLAGFASSPAVSGLLAAVAIEVAAFATVELTALR
jgi:hypothetical protein